MSTVVYRNYMGLHVAVSVAGHRNLSRDEMQSLNIYGADRLKQDYSQYHCQLHHVKLIPTEYEYEDVSIESVGGIS